MVWVGWVMVNCYQHLWLIFKSVMFCGNIKVTSLSFSLHIVTLSILCHCNTDCNYNSTVCETNRYCEIRVNSSNVLYVCVHSSNTSVERCLRPDQYRNFSGEGTYCCTSNYCNDCPPSSDACSQFSNLTSYVPSRCRSSGTFCPTSIISKCAHNVYCM